MFMGGGDPAEMMVGMAVGGVVGKHMANTMNNAMNDMQQQGAQQPPLPQAAVPPQAPGAAPSAMQFNVLLNGQSEGPFDMNALAQMARNGQITQQSPVWTQGMPNWAAAGTVRELSGLFSINMAVPHSQFHKEGVMHDERNFYSTDRLIKFGMSTNVAQQMTDSMNHAMKNMYINIPGFGNQAQLPQHRVGYQTQELPRQEFPKQEPPRQELPVQELNQPPEFIRPPDLVYYAMIDDKETGPFCETELARLINERKLVKDTYIWHTGLDEWMQAENIPAVLRLVALTPPPPPKLAPPPPPAEV